MNDLLEKLNISLAYITQANAPKDVRLNTTHFFYYENYKLNRTLTNCA